MTPFQFNQEKVHDVYCPYCNISFTTNITVSHCEKCGGKLITTIISMISGKSMREE